MRNLIVKISLLIAIVMGCTNANQIVLIGKLGDKFDSEIHLIQNGDKVSGSFIYNSQKSASIELRGVIAEGILRLEEFNNSDDKLTGIFEGKYDGKKYVGSWRDPAGNQLVNFSYTRKVDQPRDKRSNVSSVEKKMNQSYQKWVDMMVKEGNFWYMSEREEYHKKNWDNKSVTEEEYFDNCIDGLPDELGQIIYGDINHDGQPDCWSKVVPFYCNSGTIMNNANIQLFILSNPDGTYETMPQPWAITSQIGPAGHLDTILPDGTLKYEGVDYNLEDANCCPINKWDVRFIMQDGEFKKIQKTLKHKVQNIWLQNIHNLFPMEEQIFILNSDQTLLELNEHEFISERQFQELLENYPKLISGSQINPDAPRRWILVARECGVPDQENGSDKWSLDHLFIDQDGIPTLVEVKRSTDTRIRREVVGQMLDYAANAVVYWSLAEIRSKFEKYCESRDVDPEMAVLDLLEETDDVESFWTMVDTNLKAGKIRMLFVADRIPKELQRIIEFLNEQMTPAEVLGLEIKQFANNALKTLVPRVIGQTSSAQIKKGSKEYNQWTEETFLEELEQRNGKGAGDVVRKLIQYFTPKVSRFWFGKGKRSGSMIPALDLPEVSHYPFALWTYGKIELYFQWYKDKPPFDNIEKRRELLNRLNELEGVSIPENKLDKRPAIEISLLEDPQVYNQFIEVFDWFFEEVESSSIQFLL